MVMALVGSSRPPLPKVSVKGVDVEMSKAGLLINYEFCTGCHSCEIACRNERELGLGEWGIKLTEVGPFQIDDRTWNWDYAPILTSLCDLCESRVSQGADPACAHHCLAQCIEYGSLEDLAKKASEMEGKAYIITK